MNCGRYKCACAPRSAPFTCKCKERKPKKGAPTDYFTVPKCIKCKSMLSARRYGGTAVLEKIIEATEVTPPGVRTPVLKGQRKLFP